jgi:predicted enzyme related to lactoylglutathione lyase
MAKTPRRTQKKTVAKRSAAKRSAAKRSAAKRSAAKSSSSSAPSHVPTKGLYGWITHTELVSTDPEATKAWCAKVLGWTFKPSFPMPDGGEYHLFAYSNQGGGGIRRANPAEPPGSNFSVHVADTHAAFEQALREGAEAILPPTRVMEGVTIAVVRAPGGVPVGLSGP